MCPTQISGRVLRASVEPTGAGYAKPRPVAPARPRAGVRLRLRSLSISNHASLRQRAGTPGPLRRPRFEGAVGALWSAFMEVLPGNFQNPSGPDACTVSRAERQAKLDASRPRRLTEK